MEKKRYSSYLSRTDTKNTLRWLLFLRLIILLFLFVATIYMQQVRVVLKSHFYYIHSFTFASFVYTVLSLLSLKKLKKIIAFSYTQLVWDIIFVTGIIYLTGGSKSLFSFLFFLSIINASIILQRLGSFIIASASSILYSLLLMLEGPGVDVYFKISINVAGFFAVASLSSYLAEQLKKTGEELKESQVDYEDLDAINKNIVQSLNSGLITVNNVGMVTFLNHAAEDLLHYSLAKAHNKHIKKIFYGIELESDDTIKGGKRLEYKYTRSDGVELVLGLSLSDLRDAKGKYIGKVLIFQDLTNIKEMEERLNVNDKLAAIGKMAAGIAHEIRNPMASISASVQMLKQEMELDEQNKKLMDIVLRESDRLDLLITDLLLFAKPTKSAKEIVTLNPIIEDTLELITRSPKFNPAIDIVKELDQELTIKADSNQLRQVLFNLFINSLEAMNSAGELKVSMSKIQHEEDHKYYAEIIVKDSGCGIPEKILDRVYDPFFTTKEQGTGLGLAIVYRIIENHDGQIFHNPNVEKGTEFHILLPANI